MAAAGELLLNGGFEQATNGMPTNWSVNPEFMQASGTVRQGSFAGRLQSVSKKTITITSSGIAVAAGGRYTFGGAVYSVDTISMKPTVVWKNASGVTLRSDILATYTGRMAAWASFSNTLTAPAGAATMSIQLVAASLNGTIWVDAFSVAAAP
jgi:hypothetical protein